MNKETVKNIAKFFAYCQLYIPNSRELAFHDLKPLLGHYSEDSDYELSFEAAQHAFREHLTTNSAKQPFAVLTQIERLLGKIEPLLNPKQKLVFITILLKQVKTHKVMETNLFLDDVLYSIGETFDYSAEEINAIKKMFYSDKPSESDYSDSLLLTYENPDYLEVIDGLRVVYNPEFKFKIWVKNVKSVNNMLFKIIELDRSLLISGISEGDIVVYNRSIHSFLNSFHVSINSLASKIVSDQHVLPRVQIDATDRSPRVILNAEESRIEIEGISMTLQPNNFFEPVFYWLNKLKEVKPAKFEIHMNLTFFNTYASKIILKLFLQAKELEKDGCAVRYFWYSEEDDSEMREAGEHYATILNRDFMYVTTVPSEFSLV